MLRGCLSLLVLFLVAPMPAQALTLCTPGPYVVRFEPGSARLDSLQKQILDNAVDNIRPCWGISGDRTQIVVAVIEALPGPDISRSTQQQRAMTVLDYLTRKGIALERLIPVVRGDRLPYQARDPSMSVTIVFKPAPADGAIPWNAID